MLSTVREVLTDTRMAAFMAPGWGTGKDIRRAVGHGADVVRIAAHCTEASVTERHVGLVRDLGVEAQTVLLMSHMADAGRLAEECAQAVGFGAQAVGIMDSAGHYLPSDVSERIGAIVAAVDVPVIFHGHNKPLHGRGQLGRRCRGGGDDRRRVRAGIRRRGWEHSA
ncbi:MAG: hypothetical protein ACRDSL_12695 [Pseudonocardiaceae bacterium]